MTASKGIGPEAFRDSEPVERLRLPYGAVPLDPWRAKIDHDRSLYSIASIARIEKNLQQTMIEQDWFRRDDRAHEIRADARFSFGFTFCPN